MTRDGQIEERPGFEMGAVYRSCPVLRDHIALSAVLRGELEAGKRSGRVWMPYENNGLKASRTIVAPVACLRILRPRRRVNWSMNVGLRACV